MHVHEISFVRFGRVATPGQLVEAAREAQGLSQAGLADRIHVSPSMISRIEGDKVGITPAVFDKLCSVLRELSRVDFVEAIGYPIYVESESHLPEGLVKLLRQLRPDELQAVEATALGQLALRQRRDLPLA